MRLLLVEDDLALQDNLKKSLTKAQYSVDVANNGQDALYQGEEYNYDAAIIDVGLPIIDGITVIKSLRAKNINYPILVLTARDSWQDKVAGLDAGADDYLTKPFQNEELLARLNALIRRSVGQTNPILSNGALSINSKSFKVAVEGNVINLSSSEYKLLAYLMLHKGDVISKSVLTEHIYDQDFDLDSNVIEVFIRRLRKKLDPDNKFGFIETHRGLGYQLKIFDQ